MSIVTAAIIGAGASLIGGAVASNQQSKARSAAERRQQAAKREIEALKKSRQTIINPFINTKDLSGLAEDLSGQMSNAFNNLGVATEAAEIQMEQADIALANTLDNLRATGASAGGATALARAALQSKKGVSASIEQQEAANMKMRAQGEQNLQQNKLNEQKRLQLTALSEGQRVQAADAAGKQFTFAQQENRTNMDLNRAAGLEGRAAQSAADARAGEAAAYGSAFAGVSGIAAAYAGNSTTDV
tara:strand:- start:3018 stop:3752 length:735 start_codon:yes stop_codon:yes gene_type:complete